ncbi:MAG: hypothetical protein GX084_07535 [Acholeplasmataceae bacterium]|nr:hypothetical protein [Acholeplasmataceae bacterium]
MTDKAKQDNKAKREALSAAINELERKARQVALLPSKDKDLLAESLLEAISRGLTLDSEPLLKMAVRRFKILVENGAWKDEFLSGIKAVCMVALRKGQRELLNEITPVYRPILLNNPDLRIEGISDLSLLSCLAMKEGYDEIGCTCTKIILLADQSEGEEGQEVSNAALHAVKNIVVTAARSRSEKVFCLAIVKMTAHYRGKQLLPEALKLSEFFQTSLFAAADRRWEKALTQVNGFLCLLLARKLVSIEQQRKIAYEWVQLIGQIARRNWLEIVHELMRCFFVFIRRCRNDEITAYAITLMGASVKMHAAWDGFESAFRFYYPWQLAMLVLLDCYYKSGRDNNTGKLENAKMALRSLRDFALHVSRLNFNKAETEVFNQWFDLWEKAKVPKHVRQRARKMLQLTVLYWERLQPKASKNQMPHMLRIFQPNLLDNKCKRLLEN